jgi:hypothetical protein
MIKIMDDIFLNEWSDYPELPEFLKISAEDRNAAWEKVKFSNAIIAEPKFYFET